MDRAEVPSATTAALGSPLERRMGQSAAFSGDEVTVPVVVVEGSAVTAADGRFDGG